jgi:hypothetical protein
VGPSLVTEALPGEVAHIVLLDPSEDEAVIRDLADDGLLTQLAAPAKLDGGF